MSEKANDDEIVYCQCYFKGSPFGITTKICLESLNDHFQEKNLKTRCLFVSFPEEDKNSMKSTEDVDALIKKIKEDISFEYFQLPERYYEKQYMITPKQDSNYEMNSELYLRNFLSTPKTLEDADEKEYFREISE